MEDLEDQKRKKKKEKMTLGSLSRVFARGKQRKSLDPGLFDGTATPDYYIEEDADWWCWACEYVCVCLCVNEWVSTWHYLCVQSVQIRDSLEGKGRIF